MVKSQLVSYKQMVPKIQESKFTHYRKLLIWLAGASLFAVGNESVIETINLLQDHMYVSIFGAVQDAAREALLSSQSCVIDLVNSYESRRNALISACHSIGWNVDIPTGSFFAWLPVPERLYI